MQHVALQIGRDVGEKYVLRRAIALRKPRLEIGKYVQLRRQRHTLVQIFRVAPRPEKRFPRRALQPSGIDMPPAKNLRVFFREVVADNPHQADVREKARRYGKVRRRSAQRAVHFSIRAFERVEGVEGHRAHHQ